MVFNSSHLIFISVTVQKNSTGMDGKGKGKDGDIPLQTCTCLLESIIFRLPDF